MVMRLMPFVAMVFLGFLTIGLPLPVLPGWVHDGLGFGTVMVGLVVGAQSVATLLTRPYAGRQSDGRGPKWAVLTGLAICSLAGWTYLAAALLPGAAGLAALLLGRLVLGCGESLLITGALAWGIGTVGPHGTGKVMVWVGIAMFGALAAGAPAGLAILHAAGLAGVALAVAIVPLLGLVIAARVPAVATVPGKPMPFLRVAGRIWQQGAGLAFSALGYVAIAAFVPLAMAARGWGVAGTALTAFGLGYILARLLFGGLPDRLGGRRVAAASVSIEIAGQALLAWAPTPWLAVLGAAATGFGFSLVFPGLGIEAVRRVPPENRGVALGAYVACVDVAFGVGGPALGAIAGAAGYPFVFVAGAVASAISLALTLSMRSAPHPLAPSGAGPSPAAAAPARR